MINENLPSAISIIPVQTMSKKDKFNLRLD